MDFSRHTVDNSSSRASIWLPISAEILFLWKVGLLATVSLENGGTGWGRSEWGAVGSSCCQWWVEKATGRSFGSRAGLPWRSITHWSHHGYPLASAYYLSISSLQHSLQHVGVTIDRQRDVCAVP